MHWILSGIFCISLFACDKNDDPSGEEEEEEIIILDRPLLGVQRWDMYSGLGATQAQELGYLPGEQGFLKPEEWHYRAPFFCRRTVDVDWVEHPEDAGPLWFNYPFDQNVLQEAMDKEIDFATEAGIDFFIFNGPTRTLYSNGWALHNNLDAYLNNTRGDKTKFVFALYGHNGVHYGRTKVNKMLDEIVQYMQLPHWQTVKKNRPLVPVLWPLQFESMLAAQTSSSERMTLAQFVELIRKRVTDAGLGNPYIVATNINRTYQHKSRLDAAGFDAIADYQGGYGGTVAARDEGPSYATATESMIKVWEEEFLSPDIEFVPCITIGLYQWPRFNVEELYHYCESLPGDVTDRVKSTFDFIYEHLQECRAQVVFSYNWNEHPDGGAICPTMGESPDYIPVTTTIDEVEEALSSW